MGGDELHVILHTTCTLQIFWRETFEVFRFFPLGCDNLRNFLKFLIALVVRASTLCKSFNATN